MEELPETKFAVIHTRLDHHEKRMDKMEDSAKEERKETENSFHKYSGRLANAEFSVKEISKSHDRICEMAEHFQTAALTMPQAIGDSVTKALKPIYDKLETHEGRIATTEQREMKYRWTIAGGLTVAATMIAGGIWAANLILENLESVVSAIRLVKTGM